MRFDWAIVCHDVKVNGPLATIIDAGIDTLGVPVLPIDLRVVIAARLVGLPEDVANPAGHQIVSRVLDPRMAEIERLEMNYLTELIPGATPGWELGAIIPIVSTFRAEQEGAYLIDLDVGGRSQSVAVMVRLFNQGPGR